MAIWQDLWEKVKVLFSAAWPVIYPYLKQFLSEEGAMVLAMAPSVVAVIQDTMGDADGGAKRQEAFVRIQAALTAQGIKIAANIIYSEIEAAVAKLKATTQTLDEAKMIKEGLMNPGPTPTVQP